MLAALWPTIFGDEREETPPVERVVLPPEPMYRDPMGGEWQPL